MTLIRTALVAGALVLTAGSACHEGPAEPPVPRGDGTWEFLGPEGEYVADIELSPWGLFVGTYGGIGRQRENGNWEWLSPDYWDGHLYPQALLFVPGDPPRLLAGVKFSGGTKEDTTAAAVFASEDRGQTWYMSDGGLAENADNQYRVYVDDLQLDPFDSDVVFMSGELGILRSRDGGRSWNFALGSYDTFGGIYGPLLMDQETPGQIWHSGYTAFGYGRIGVSHDGGNGWDVAHASCNGDAPVPPVYDIQTGPPSSPESVWLGWNNGVMLAHAGDGAPREWACEPEPGDPALFLEHSVISLAWFEGALYAAGNIVHVEVISPDSVEETSRMPALYRLREGANSWDTLPAPETAAGPTGAMIADTARGRLLIGTRKGLWAFTPPD